MKRMTATVIGVLLAAGLAVAAPRDDATELVNRYLSATTEAAITASWKDWHPRAAHHVKVKTGMKDGDFEFSYAMSNWENLPDWTEAPQVQEAMQGYEETRRSEPDLKVSVKGATTIVNAQTRVAYVWQGYQGTMTQTDQFEITMLVGRAVIRDLTTVYDYR